MGNKKLIKSIIFAGTGEAKRKISKQLLSFIERRNNAILVVIISVVVFSGILYSLYLDGDLRYADERDYYTLATNIVTGHQYSLDGKHSTSFRPPGYPLFLSFFILLGADIVHLRILNFVALGLCIYLLHKILKEQSSPVAGIFGALLVVCYPVLFYTAGTLYPQTIGSFLFLLIIFLSTKNIKSYRTFVLSGLLFGYLLLTISIFVFILFVIGMWFYFSKSSIRKNGIFITIVIAFSFMGIWSARHYAVFKCFLLVSSNSGFMMLAGNSENTTPNAGPTVDISKYKAEATRLQLNEVERDAYYRSQAIKWILSHKGKASKLFCLKFLNYFNYRNILATKSEASSAKDILMLITYGPLLLMFAFRILLLRLLKLSAFEVLLVILYVSSALFYTIFFTRIRYRLPFDFLLIALVAMFLQHILHVWLGGNVNHNEQSSCC